MIIKVHVSTIELTEREREREREKRGSHWKFVILLWSQIVTSLSYSDFIENIVQTKISISGLYANWCEQWAEKAVRHSQMIHVSYNSMDC